MSHSKFIYLKNKFSWKEYHEAKTFYYKLRDSTWLKWKKTKLTDTETGWWKHFEMKQTS